MKRINTAKSPAAPTFAALLMAALSLVSALALYGCGKPAPKGAPVRVEYMTAYSDELGGTEKRYSLALPEGGVLGEDGAELTVSGTGYEYDSVLGGDVLAELGEIIDDNGIAAWDGYNKSKDGKGADRSFSLTAVYPDGTRVSAAGNNSFPRGWEDGNRALSGFFDGLVDEEALIAAGGGRTAAQSEPDSGEVPVTIDLFSFSVKEDPASASVTEYIGGAPGGAVEVPDQHNGVIVTGIESRAFADSDAVSVYMGSYIGKLGEECFENCASLTEVSLPSGLVSVPRRAFAGCVSLRSVALPSMVQFVEPQAFMGCESLSQVSLNEGLLSVGSQVFSGCSSLRRVSIPYSVTFIGEDAFAGCPEDLELAVYPGSYGLEYAKANNIRYTEVKLSGGAE